MEKNILGTEKISKLLVKFSIPGIVGMMVNALYNVVDRIFIGRAEGLGANGIAGITIGFPITLVIMALAVLFGVGGSTFFSINLGMKKFDIAGRTLGSSFALSIVSGLLITIFGELFLVNILTSLGASSEVLPFSIEYTRVILIGVPFVITSMVLNNFMRADSSPRLAMMTMFLGAGTNIVLDPIFIYIFKWGMTGAALATIISQFISFVWTISYFLSKKRAHRLTKENVRFDFTIIPKILSLGTPLFLFQLSGSLLTIILNKSLIAYGSDIAISAMGITNSVQSIFFMPVIGLNQGVQPIVSYNYGAKYFDRIKETQKLAIISATVMVFIGWVLTRLIADKIVGMFTDDADLIVISTMFLQRWLLCYPLNGFTVIGSNFFQATARPNISMFLMLTRTVLILIPAVIILPRIWGLDGLLYAAAASDSISFIIVLLFYIRGIKTLE